MPAQVVPREQTPLNMVEVTAKLAAVFHDLWGVMPSESLLRIAAGIIGIENAGGWAIWNGNFGNVTAPAGYAGRVWEANGLYFLDFGTEIGSLEAGARAWWLLMSARYHDALIGAEQGNVASAVRDMFRMGYVGAGWTGKQLTDYVRGVEHWAGEAAYSAKVISEHFRKRWIGASIAASSVLAVAAGGYYWHRQRRAAA